MKYIWIGGVAPAKRFKILSEQGNSQFAANNMQLQYLKGIRKNLGELPIVISAHFMFSYPKCKTIIFKKKVYDKWTDVGFINIPVFKQLSKAYNVSKEVKKILKRDKNEEFVFFIYSMTTPLMHASKTIKQIAKKYSIKVQVVQIVPDLPEYMNFEKKNKLWHLAKKADIRVIHKLQKNIDKYVLFSEYMNKKLKINKEKYIVIEGMIDESECLKQIKEKGNYIMYAGGINEKYGVYDLIRSFKKLNLKNTELRLFGPCDNEEKLYSIIGDANNIKYCGSKDREIILKMERRALLLINPRKPTNDFTAYSFPSKTLEYLASGTPTLIYKLKGIPDEYDEYINYLDINDNNSITKNISIIMSNRKKYLAKSKKAQSFIANNKNSYNQCKRLLDLVNGKGSA